MNNEITITVAGETGSGKTTMARHLAEFLALTGWDVKFDTNSETEASRPRRPDEKAIVNGIRPQASVVIREQPISRKRPVEFDIIKPTTPCMGIGEYEANFDVTCQYWSSHTDGCVTCPKYHANME